MVNAVKFLGFRHIGCVAHTINLIVQDGIEANPELSDAFHHAKDIVRYFKSSNLAAEALKAAQRDTGLKELSLIKSVDTRWFSELAMSSRLLEMEMAVTIAQTRLRQDATTRSEVPPILNGDKITLLKEAVAALEVLQGAQTLLSGEKYPTASSAIPMVQGLVDKLTASYNAATTTTGKHFVTAILTGISNRMYAYEKNPVFAAATVLDPRFKKYGFRAEANYEAGYKQVEGELRRHLGEPGAAEPDETDPDDTQPDAAEPDAAQPPKRSIDILDCVTRRVKMAKTTATPTSTAMVLMQQYVRRTNLPLEGDVVKYWRERSGDFQPLADIAERYLVCPSTSVPSERAFSSAGQIISERRSRLKPEKAAMLIFLKQNSWMY